MDERLLLRPHRDDVLAPGKDDTGGPEPRGDRLDQLRLSGGRQLRVAGEKLQNVGRVGRRMDPAGAGDETAQVLLGRQVERRGSEEVVERPLRQLRSLQVGGREDREPEGRERLSAGRGPRRLSAAFLQTGLQLLPEPLEVGRGNEAVPVDPAREGAGRLSLGNGELLRGESGSEGPVVGLRLGGGGHGEQEGEGTGGEAHTPFTSPSTPGFGDRPRSERREPRLRTRSSPLPPPSRSAPGPRCACRRCGCRSS